MTLFISYASKNQELVQALIDHLEEADYPIWYDQELIGGQRWWDAILEQIRQCSAFIISLTVDWLESDACRREYYYAMSLGKYVLPIALTEIEIYTLPADLVNTQIVYWPSQVARLHRALRSAESPPLPHLLPTPPSVPISPIFSLADRLYDDESMSLQEQETQLDELERFLADGKNVSHALGVLEHWLSRPDLLYRVGQRLNALWTTYGQPIQAQRQRRASPLQLQPREFDLSYEVHHVAFSEDDRHILTGTNQHDLRQLWDSETGELVAEFKAMALSPDCRLMFVKTSLLTAEIREVKTDGVISTFDIASSERRIAWDSGWRSDFQAAAFSPDGRYVLTGDSYDGTARLWDVMTGKQVRQYIHNSIDTHVTNAGNRTVYRGGTYMVGFISQKGVIYTNLGFWDVDSIKFMGRPYDFYTNNKFGTFSTDLRFLLTVNNSDKSIAELRDAETFQVLNNIPFPLDVRQMIALPNGKYAYIGIDKKSTEIIKAIDYGIGNELKRYERHTNSVQAIAVSSDGRYMVSGGDDKLMCLWALDLF